MKRLEQSLHISSVAFMHRAMPQGVVFFHCPNGGKRTKAEAGLFRAFGVRAGVPDLLLIMPNGQAAFIEFKAPDGVLSDVQADFCEEVRRLRCAYAVIRSMEELEATLTRWLAAYGLSLHASISVRRAA